VATLLARTDAMLREGRAPGATVWPTGFGRLDGVLGGGVRSGELALIAGSQGQGKTTFGLQMLRQVATIGRPAVFFSFEHESHTLLERLLAMEGAYAADADPQGLSPADVGRVRAVFEQVDAPGANLASMMGVLPRGAAALAAVEAYAQRLHLHESSPTTYREWVVVSVEKNRHGNDNVVLEFEKDFAHGRFHPEGRPVEERLIEERVFRE